MLNERMSPRNYLMESLQLMTSLSNLEKFSNTTCYPTELLNLEILKRNLKNKVEEEEEELERMITAKRDKLGQK